MKLDVGVWGLGFGVWGLGVTAMQRSRLCWAAYRIVSFTSCVQGCLAYKKTHSPRTLS